MNTSLDGITLEGIIDHFIFFMFKMTELSQNLESEMASDENISYYYNHSADQLLNGIFVNEGDCLELSDRIIKLIKRFSAYRHPYTLWCSENILGPNFKETLGLQNLKDCSPLICIGAKLDEINPVPVMESLEITPVMTRYEYQIYMNILSIGFKLNGSIGDDFKTMLADYGCEDSRYRHYIAYLEGTAVSVISTVRYKNALGMYCGATLPQYQQRGICTELYRYTMEEGIHAGCTTCVYQSANQAVINNISKKFGFREYGKLHRLVIA